MESHEILCDSSLMCFIGCKAARAAVAWIGIGWLASRLLAGDVPLGHLLWLQGVDGSLPVPGFEIDGTLRLESIDEPLDVGLVIGPGRVTNSMTGQIKVKPGPGGARYVVGPVLNFGEIDVDSINLSWYGGGRCENHGVIKLSGYAGFGFYGPETVLDLQAGAIVKADQRTGYVWVQDGRFLFNGGTVDFPVYVARGSASVGAGATNPITINFVGPGCLFDGTIPTNCTLRLWAEDRFPPLTLTLTNAPRLDGAVHVDRQTSGTPMALTLAAGGLFVSTHGTMTVAAGGPGIRVIGNLTNAGNIMQSGPLELSGDLPVVNAGSWTLAEGASLTVATPWVQTEGSFVLDGGHISARAGLTLSGGDLSGNGSILGSVTNRVAVTLSRNRPLFVAGDWTQGDTASLEIKVAADDLSPDVAALRIDGRLTLSGPLRVTADASVKWSPGQAVAIVSATDLSGWFTDVQMPVLPEGMHWTLEPSGNVYRFVTSTHPPAIQLSGQYGDTNSSLTLYGAPGTGLVVERSTRLDGWQTVTNQIRFTGLARFDVLGTDAPEQWFRARYTPTSGH